MNDEVIQDLKQFISATISQQTAHLANKNDIARIEDKINEIQSAIEQSAIGYTTVVDEQVQDHEKRIIRLEQKTV